MSATETDRTDSKKGEVSPSPSTTAGAPSSLDAAPPSRKHRRPPRPLILLLVLAIAGAGWWYYSSISTPPPAGIFASGTIEAEEVAISSEISGRVVELMADEGDQVRAGQTLVKLDDSTARLQLKSVPMNDRPMQELLLAKTEIKSPLDGVVIRRSIRVGEVATPGAALMAVTRLDEAELTVYVPEKEVGRVTLGQPVDVAVDSFPGDKFRGKVSYISTKAEFTPRNVQTQKDRLNLVFAVKVRIPNLDMRLKPGMPADATILY